MSSDLQVMYNCREPDHLRELTCCTQMACFACLVALLPTSTHKHMLPSLCKAQAYLLCLPCPSSLCLQSSLSSFHGRAPCSRPEAPPHTASTDTRHAHRDSPVALIPIDGSMREQTDRERERSTQQHRCEWGDYK